MIRTSLIALIFLGLAVGAIAKPIDVLKQEDFWELHETSERIFSFRDDFLRVKRRSNESATILSRKDYENFRLTFELQHKNDCELILVLHAPRNGAWAAGQEIVLSEHPDQAPSPFVTGAIFNRRAGESNPIKRHGGWNDVDITMDWPQLTVQINGRVVQDLNLEDDENLRYTLRRGAIAFRDLLGWGFDMRNVMLEELPSTEHGRRLFNGNDLFGWKEVRASDARWSVEDGVIVGDDGDGYLQYELVCQDFDLRLMYQTTPTANGGVFFRWKTDDSERGDEIQILDVPQAISPSGTVYSLQRADGSPIRPGDWNLMQVRVVGEHAVVHVNGVRVAETRELRNIWPGHITLQMHKDGSTIRFKDIVLVNYDLPEPENRNDGRRRAVQQRSGTN